MNEKKIFILDDEDEILELMHFILDSKYTIRSANNVDRFEETIEEFQPDLIIIDHFIGNKKSQDVLVNYSGDLHSIPTILHSGHEQIEQIARDSNITAFLKKPSSIKEIRNKIEEVLTATS